MMLYVKYMEDRTMITKKVALEQLRDIALLVYRITGKPEGRSFHEFDINPDLYREFIEASMGLECIVKYIKKNLRDNLTVE